MDQPGASSCVQQEGGYDGGGSAARRKQLHRMPQRAILAVMSVLSRDTGPATVFPPVLRTRPLSART